MKIYCLFFGLLLANQLFALDRSSTVRGYNAEDSTKVVYIPKNLKDCIKQLDLILSDSTKNEIKAMSQGDFLAGAHFGLGMWIRNNWSLWHKNSRLYVYFSKINSYYEPDLVSGDILSFYYLHLKKDKSLKAEIKKYESRAKKKGL